MAARKSPEEREAIDLRIAIGPHRNPSITRAVEVIKRLEELGVRTDEDLHSLARLGYRKGRKAEYRANDPTR